MKNTFFLCLLLLVISFPFKHQAQEIAVGQWQTHYAYSSARSIEKVGDMVFVADVQLYAYSLSEQDYSFFSKVNGLSDVNIRLIRYDPASGYLLLIYENGNLDLLRDGQVLNMPDIRNLNITGSKRINQVFFYQKLMYLCTDFGIVVLNPERQEIKESYVLQLNGEVIQIQDMTQDKGYFLASGPAGIFKAPISGSNLQNFANWQRVTDTAIRYVFNHQGQVFACSDTMLYRLDAQGLLPLYDHLAPVIRIRQGSTDFYACERNADRRRIMIFNAQGQLIDSVTTVNASDVVETSPSEIWEADQWEGLIRLSERRNKTTFNPNAPFSNACYKLTVHNQDLYVSSGGESEWQPTYSSEGISKRSNGVWTFINRYQGITAMDTTFDILDVAIDPKTQTLYAGSYGGGLLEIPPGQTPKVYKNNGFITQQVGNPGFNIVYNLQFDRARNLWMTNYSAADQLIVKKADGNWQKFALPHPGSDRTAAELVLDDIDQKWIVAPRGVGVFVYNDQGTLDVKTDDQVRLLTKGTGNGNLPDNDVLSIAKDLNGKIWIGTADGIGIINCPESMFSNNPCDAELKIVKYDLNAGLLFQREAVNTIAVDGANNKWIGTNNGVWLISDDAENIIHRFTADNSPLPSNEIRHIAILPQTGEVFFATTNGLVSYRGQATAGKEDNSQLQIFPNPVPRNYQGTIAIRGLVENADVRITDVAGQLVFRTRAQGGQAVWDGRNYLGEKPRTGVYYVFVTNADGSQTATGKFILSE